MVVPLEGFEPPTYRLRSGRCYQLSYNGDANLFSKFASLSSTKIYRRVIRPPTGATHVFPVIAEYRER